MGQQRKTIKSQLIPQEQIKQQYFSELYFQINAISKLGNVLLDLITFVLFMPVVIF
jgi:hypothetical protein